MSCWIWPPTATIFKLETLTTKSLIWPSSIFSAFAYGFYFLNFCCVPHSPMNCGPAHRWMHLTYPTNEFAATTDGFSFSYLICFYLLSLLCLQYGIVAKWIAGGIDWCRAKLWRLTILKWKILVWLFRSCLYFFKEFLFYCNLTLHNITQHITVTDIFLIPH